MAQKPARVQDEVAAIKAKLDRVMHNYRWQHAAAYAKGTRAKEVIVSTSGHSDPTVDAHDQGRRIRKQLEKCDRALVDAFKAIDRADAALSKAEGNATQPSGNWPQIVDPREVNEAVAAQQRRTARGEGYGES